MASFEEDAFARAQQMHRRPPQHNNSNRQASVQPPVQEVIQTPSEQPSEPAVKDTSQGDGVLNVLFKDKEQSLILLLIVLLMEENSNPSLLLALIYLLI